MPRTFVPLGEFLPDQRLLSNEGLLRAYGVIPLSGNYIRAPHVTFVGSFPPTLTPLSHTSELDPPFGFYIHSPTLGYYGTEGKLVEIALATAAETVRTRTVGGAYAFATSPPGDGEFWWFTSYGENVIATNLEDDVQYLATPGSGNFAKLIASTFSPRAKFAFPVKGNLFLAHCALDASYDGIAVGLHPQLVAWSQSNVVSNFGTASGGNPQYIGSGYQNLDNDLGEITAVSGGGFGLLFQEKGITRVDGPPYEFVPIVEGDTTIYPYSVFRLGDDVYFWGSGGPSVLRGGLPPVVRLGRGKLQRSLLDNATGFGAAFARALDLKVREVSGAPDSVNELLRWSYRPIAGAEAAPEADPAEPPPTLFLDHNIGEERFTVSRSPCEPITIGGVTTLVPTRDLFLRAAPPTPSASWGPFGQVYALHVEESLGNLAYLVRFALDENYQASYPDLVFQTGFGRLDEEMVTRIVAVRPVWSGTSANVDAIVSGLSVTTHTKSKPYEASEDRGPFSVVDADGWVPAPTAIFGTLHSISLAFGGQEQFDGNEIHEIEALEVEFALGGKHGA